MGHGDYVRCADFMPGTMSSMIVSGSYDSTVRLWDPRTGSNSAVMTFKHAAPVEDVLSLPSGTTVLAAADNSVSVLDLVGGATSTYDYEPSEDRHLSEPGVQRPPARHGWPWKGHVKVFETTGWNVVSSTKYHHLFSPSR